MLRAQIHEANKIIASSRLGAAGDWLAIAGARLLVGRGQVMQILLENTDRDRNKREDTTLWGDRIG